MVKFLMLLSLIVLLILVYNRVRRRKLRIQSEFRLPAGAAGLLEKHVAFYRKLDAEGRRLFEDRVRRFLARTRVTGVGVAITDTDRLLVASGAVIPIFHFPDWEYRNIHEVLLYPDTFSKEFATSGRDRNVLGMVGDGAMNDHMILSLPALRGGFRSNDGRNTALHEFVHLIDKADGQVDGVPEYLLDRPEIQPWVRHMHWMIRAIRDGRSDIDVYGATNEAEFFAVVAEYFLEKPGQLQKEHPQLHELLERMFSGEPPPEEQPAG